MSWDAKRLSNFRFYCRCVTAPYHSCWLPLPTPGLTGTSLVKLGWSEPVTSNWMPIRCANNTTEGDKTVRYGCHWQAHTAVVQSAIQCYALTVKAANACSILVSKATFTGVSNQIASIASVSIPRPRHKVRFIVSWIGGNCYRNKCGLDDGILYVVSLSWQSNSVNLSRIKGNRNSIAKHSAGTAH